MFLLFCTLIFIIRIILENKRYKITDDTIILQINYFLFGWYTNFCHLVLFILIIGLTPKNKRYKKNRKINSKINYLLFNRSTNFYHIQTSIVTIEQIYFEYE